MMVMLDMKPLKIEELTAAPGITSVSEVAKGGTPITGQEEKEMTLKKPGQPPMQENKKEDDCCEDEGEMDGEHCTVEEMQEAYAKIFEGLATLSRS